jgi:dTDP-4-dehydrorhamnose 3,5-epimerase-like enzyme
MQAVETELADIKILKPIRHADPSGFFSEVFKECQLPQLVSISILYRTIIRCRR